MRTTSFVLGCLGAIAQVQAGDKKCRALALSGGANHGAWEAGVMWGLLHYGNPEDYSWDVVTGVSAGAINTAAISTFAPEDTLNMTEYLSGAWAGIHSNDEIWLNWPEGPAKALFNKGGILDNSPATGFIKKTMDGSGSTEFKRTFTVAAANVETGEYTPFNNDNITFEEMPTAAMSSGSIPTVFAPQHFHGKYLMDGGTIWDVNVQSAIEQCLEIVEDQSDIILDVMICDYQEDLTTPDKANTIHNFWRQRQIHHFYNDSNDVNEQEAPYPMVNYRSYFQDNDDCEIKNLLDFTNSTTWCLQETGREDAKKYLAAQGLLNLEEEPKLRQEHQSSSMLSKVQGFFRKMKFIF